MKEFDKNGLIERIRTSPFHSWMGQVLVDAEPGRAEMRLELQHHHLNPQGIVHGGVIASLLDSVCGISLRTVLPDGYTHRTIQLSISYVRATRTGFLIGRGRAVHEGRRVGHGEGEVYDDEGRLLARATAVFINLPAEGE